MLKIKILRELLSVHTRRLIGLLLVVGIGLGLVNCGSIVFPTITADPSDQTVMVGQTATFKVVASATGPLSYQWQKGGAGILGATSASYTTPPSTVADSGAKFQVVITSSGRTVISNPAVLTVNTRDVLTYHNDNGRTGQNLSETVLTRANVNSAQFGKIGFYAVDGLVDAQPLYLESVNIPNLGLHNVLYVATEHNSLYAFDADSGAQLWKISLLPAGEIASDTPHCNAVYPEIGITATPVIDRTRGVIYVVAASTGSTDKTNHFQRLHAIDITTGAELFGGPKEIQATYPGNGPNSLGGTVVFDPNEHLERAALLLLNGVVYTSWGSHCDNPPYNGWIIGYDASTLAQTAVLDLVPNGQAGAIWMSGAGPAADSEGNIYLLDANGNFDSDLDGDGFPGEGDYGNAFLKISTAGGLTVADYFEMYFEQSENAEDEDLGSGGALVLPDMTDGTGKVWHLAVGAGKDANMYVVNRDAMGKFTPGRNSIYQEVPVVLPHGIFGMPAYFNNTLYYGPVGSPIKAFPVINATVAGAPSSQSVTSMGYPGVTPSISANGSGDAILWALENVGFTCVSYNSCGAPNSTLHAYDATNLAKELYNSNQAGSRDQLGAGNKFITPTVVNGKVYVGTTNGVAVFGLLH